MSTLWMRYAGLALALLWGGWWTFFAFAVGISEGSVGVRQLVVTLAGLSGFVLAWRWEAVGGALLVLEGLFFVFLLATGFLWRDLQNTIFLIFALVLPPLAAGILLLADWWKTRSFGGA